MAERVANELGERDVVHLRCSPLERAQETMAPLAAALDLPVTIDGRVLEARTTSRAEGVISQHAAEREELAALPQSADAELG